MNAIGFNKFGSADVLERLEVKNLVPDENEVTIRIAYTSVNMLDILVRKSYIGLNISMPHVPGADVCGKIEAVGKGVSEFSPGEDVIAHTMLACGLCRECLSGNEAICSRYKIVGRDMWGSYGELIKLPSSLVVKSPKQLSQKELACMPLCIATSWRALHTLADAKEGDTVVVRGASGNVGITSVLLGKAMGLKVIAITRDEDKAMRLKQLNADTVISTKDSDVVKDVKEFTGGVGADFVLDPLGSTLEQSVEMLHDGGKVILFGTAAGSMSSIDVKKIYLRSKKIVGTRAFE